MKYEWLEQFYFRLNRSKNACNVLLASLILGFSFIKSGDRESRIDSTSSSLRKRDTVGKDCCPRGAFKRSDR